MVRLHSSHLLCGRLLWPPRETNPRGLILGVKCAPVHPRGSSETYKDQDSSHHPLKAEKEKKRKSTWMNVKTDIFPFELKAYEVWTAHEHVPVMKACMDPEGIARESMSHCARKRRGTQWDTFVVLHVIWLYKTRVYSALNYLVAFF